MRATRNARLHGRDGRADRTVQVRELADRGDDGLGPRVQPHLDLGDHAERALAADVEVRQVQPGRRLARPPAGVDHLPVGRDHGQAEHVLAHRAVADGVGARRARGGHAAERGVGAGVDGEEQPGVAHRGVQRLARDAGLHAAVHGFGRDRAPCRAATGRARRRRAAPPAALRATSPRRTAPPARGGRGTASGSPRPRRCRSGTRPRRACRRPATLRRGCAARAAPGR